MSSDSNAEKLAAARKLLKQHQKKKKETVDIAPPSTQPSIPTPAPYSFPNNNGTPPPHSIQQNGNAPNISPPPPPTTFYSTTPAPPPLLDPTQFFDQIKTPSTSSDMSGDSSRVDSTENIGGVPNFPGVNYFSTTQPPSNDRTDTSSNSSRSEDDSMKRLVNVENQLVVEIARKDELQSRLTEANERISFLDNHLSRIQNQDVHNHDDRSSLEDKIKLQQKTIEILVREKSELQQELANVTEDNNRSSLKCMELSVKLKALKSEVIRLQSEAQDSSEARQQHNSILRKLELSLRETNESAEQYKKEVLEAQQEIKVLNRKLTETNDNNARFKSTVVDLEKKLSMAEMKIAQLGGADLPSTPQDDNTDYRLECESLKQELDHSRKELTETVTQYRDYIEMLRVQLSEAVSQNEVNSKEKNELLAHKEGLVRQLSELEKQIPKDRQTGSSLSQSNVLLSEKIASAESQIADLEAKLVEKVSENERLAEEVTATSARLQEAERTLDQLEVPDVKLLQAAMESDRIAASRAIEQNNSLKAQLAELTTEMSQSIVKLNNEKLDLTEKLQHAEHLVKELQHQIQHHDHHHDHDHDNDHHHHHHDHSKEFVDAVAQCTVVFKTEEGSQTDVDDILLDTATESEVSTESVRLLELKLKKTMNLVASLTEEKQKLEHLNIQLQSETETICEYVTLYQNQRGLLQEKALERERQLVLLAKEREELKNRLNQINSLLPKAMPDSSIQNNGKNESVAEASQKIKTLLNEIESSDIIQSPLDSSPTNFHPCLLCSGKLITV